MKKESTQKYIIKLSQVFLLGCFSFLSFFLFYDNAFADTTYYSQPVGGYDLNQDNDGYGPTDSIRKTVDLPGYNFSSIGADVYVNFWYNGTWDGSGDMIFQIQGNAGGGNVTCLSSTNFKDLITPDVPTFVSVLAYSFDLNNCSNQLTTMIFTNTGYVSNVRADGDLNTQFWVTDVPIDPPVENDATRIAIVLPENNATTTSPVELEWEYYVNSETHGDLDELNVDINIMNPLLVSGTMGINIPIETIVYDSLITGTTSVELANNQVYSWNAKLVTETDSCNNPLLSVIFCAFQSATESSIATSERRLFIIGTDPRTSVTDFGNSLFDAAGGDSNLLGGGCAFVATSTCEITSPSTYGGCFTNSVIIAFCPSANTITYATTTLMQSFYDKMPFGFFIQPYVKIAELTGSSTESLGTDITVSIPQLGNGTTTIFSWSEAKDFMDNTIGEGMVTTLMIVEFVGLIFYLFYRLIGSTKKENT